MPAERKALRRKRTALHRKHKALHRKELRRGALKRGRLRNKTET